MKTTEEKTDRYADIMVALVVIIGIYFAIWTLIGLIL